MSVFKALQRIVVALVSLVALLACSASPAFAAEGAWWHLFSGARPTYLPPGGEGVVVATAINFGEAPTSGPIRIVDRLPAGLRPVSIEATTAHGLETGSTKGLPEVAACAFESIEGEQTAVCTFNETYYGGRRTGLPFAPLEVRVAVKVQGAHSGELNEVSVTGGGAPPASITRPLTIANPGEGTPFGIENWEVTPEEAGGSVDTQAGSHPFQTTFAFDLNQTAETLNGAGQLTVNPAGGLARDVHVKLPPGLIGDPQAVARCTVRQFLALPNECPVSSVIGVSVSSVTLPKFYGFANLAVPVFNLEPGPGEAARFGFLPSGPETPVYISATVRGGGDYGVDANVSQITQTAAFTTSVVTFWGVPASPAHAQTRDGCLTATVGKYPPCEAVSPISSPAFFELPTSCPGEPLRSSVEVDSWQNPGNFVTGENIAMLRTGEHGNAAMPAIDGCNSLPFNPSLKVTPDGEAASTPTGLNVDVHNPQEESLSANGLGEADVRDVTVALPPGVQINPSGGDGLEGCSSNPGVLAPGTLGSPGDQIGYEGNEEPELEPGVNLPRFSPYLPGSTGALAANVPGGERLEPGINFCANASKIGTVRVKTPLLKHELEGAVYLGAQEANPFGSLIAMYLVMEDPESGVLIKSPGEVRLCQSAGETIDGKTCEALGQIITTFLNLAQAPFEDAELHFFGGERAPLASPAHCGAYTTAASFTPWSGNEAVNATSTFNVTRGPATPASRGGTPCPGASLPFNPSSTGGATNVNAGAFSPFTTTLSRESGEQSIQSAEVRLPPGVSGLLTGVELCREPQASQGTCGANSQIGETTVSVGVGGDPFTVKGGRVYLTGPYNGTRECTVGEPGCAPFGLSVVNPAKAGPFDLADTKNNHPACDCVLVRAKIEVNPETSALTITSDPPGSPDAIPTSIEGIPLQIQHVNITTTRDDFQFNPTNCEKMKVEATLHSAEGGVDQIEVPFQVTNCAILAFAPKFAVSTSVKTSRANGASLSVHLTYPSAPFGTQANIARVKVELPKALPSRLTTLQKACSSAQFDANPAGCPPASIVGHAKAITPLIPVPLEGPAYFVSHGGEAFPSLVIVLQGYGVTIDLVGSTFINERTGVTSSTFKTVPDQPVGSFELTLPEGQYSALAANKDLCKVKNLVMPTEFVAQNGAEIHESTKIQVTGCPKHKAKKAGHAKHREKAAHRKKGKKRKR